VRTTRGMRVALTPVSRRSDIRLMDLLQIFPHLNASLNGLSSVFLLAGFYFIMRARVRAHHLCMSTALVISGLFLVSYLTYHALRSYYFGLGPTKFTGEGIVRPIYFT